MVFSGNFYTTAQHKQSPNGRTFAQSGHPDCLETKFVFPFMVLRSEFRILPRPLFAKVL
jgi:hypothetical protein